MLLPDYDQLSLLPLPGEGLAAARPEPIEASAAGSAFLCDALVQEPAGNGGIRMLVPMLGGAGRVEVLAFTADDPVEHDRRLARRFAGLLADVLSTKSSYTDRLCQARRRQPMSLSAEMQWLLLPPLSMTTAQVAVAGIVEPAYAGGGDSFDYALNGDTLHFAIIDAMGHGLDAAVMGTVALAAYRHARRTEVDLPDLYAAMDAAIHAQFDDDRFVTGQMARLDVGTGRLSWVNAGHPRPLLIRGGRVDRALRSPTTLPAGIGGATPQVTHEELQPGDRVLFFTDGIVEERLSSGERFGHERLHVLLEQAETRGGPVQQTVRQLSHALLREPGQDQRRCQPFPGGMAWRRSRRPWSQPLGRGTLPFRACGVSVGLAGRPAYWWRPGVGSALPT